MDNANYVGSTGISGGLVLWWSNEIQVTILTNDKTIIDCKVDSSSFGGCFYITWVYGDADFARRARNWQTLRAIGVNRRDAWICLGDFNDISHRWEKTGGIRKE